MAIVDRAPSPGIEVREQFRPQAQPTETYVRPATPPRSNLYSLAEGLQGFSASLKGVFDKRAAKDAEDAAIRGEAQFMKDNSVGYAEAVRQGKIPAFASPEFVKGYKRSEGQLMGKRLAAKFQLEYTTWSGRNSQDPAAFDGFMADFLKTNMATDDPDILAGALPFIRNTSEAGFAANTQERSDNLTNSAIISSVANVGMDMDHASDVGLTSGSGTDYDAVWAAMVTNRSDALGRGINEDKYDRQLIDVIVGKAHEQKDFKLLELLDRKVPGKDYSYADTPYGRTVKATAIDQFESAYNAGESRAYTIQERKQKALKDQLTASALEALAADPNHAFTPEFLSEFEKVDPEARIHILDWSKKLDETVEDDGEILALKTRIFNGEDPREVIASGMNAGTIRKSSTLSDLTTYGSGADKRGSFSGNSAYQQGSKALRAALTPSGEDNFWNPDKTSDEAMQAQLDYERAMSDFMEKNPNADQMAVSEEATRVYGILSKAIVKKDGGETLYATPDQQLPETDQPNPLGVTQTQIKAEQDQAAVDAAKPEAVMDVWGSREEPPTLDALPQNERAAIEAAASANGDDPQFLVDKMWKHIQEGIDQENLKAGIGDVFDEAFKPDGRGGGAYTPESFIDTNGDGYLEAPGIQYELEGKTRDKPVSETWLNRVGGVLHQMPGVTVAITSGGQDDKKRTGSHRHDVDDTGHSETADVVLMKDGQKVTPVQDPELYAEFLRNAASQGFTGIGHYAWGVHIGMGTKAMWGPSTTSKDLDPTFAAAIKDGWRNGTHREDVAMAQPVLNFLSEAEGTGGDYNATFGKGMFSGGKQDLVNMSVADVQSLQAKMITDPSNKMKSGAIGKYQFTMGTLKELMESEDIKPTAKFTPQLQDRLAVALLKKRGLAEWMAGKLTDAEFQDRLAKEWASLPKANGTANYGHGGTASGPKLLMALATLKK